MSQFKNVKVNYTDFDGKRTSTTINFSICENLYWEKVDIETRKKMIGEENYQEKERKLITEIAQEFVNNLLKSQKEDVGSIRGTSQYGIESNMLMELMK
jgi:vacuolar-type H+-ATPase subunit B/Vma2